MNRIITASAIETAIKNEAKMYEQGYTLKQSVAVPTSYHVIKPGFNGRNSYVVDTKPGYRFCQCEQFKIEGVCKHQLFVDNHIEVCEREAEYDAREDARYEVIAGKY